MRSTRGHSSTAARASAATVSPGASAIELPLPAAVAAPEILGPAPRIAWEDEYLAVVDKPAGLTVHPGAGRPARHARRRARGPRLGRRARAAGIVHRLDRDTSGLMVVARSEEAHKRLSALVRRRALERTYLALVRGRPASRAGRIEAPIGRDRDDPTRFSLETDTPRDAVTHFELAEAHRRASLLRVKLETGRTHQIRVHLAAIGLPVIGDRVYGVTDPALARQFLHASRLAFTAPVQRRADRRRVAASRPSSQRSSTPSTTTEAASRYAFAALRTLDPTEASRRTVAGNEPVPPRRRRSISNRNRERGLPCPLSP